MSSDITVMHGVRAGFTTRSAVHISSHVPQLCCVHAAPERMRAGLEPTALGSRVSSSQGSSQQSPKAPRGVSGDPPKPSHPSSCSRGPPPGSPARARAARRYKVERPVRSSSSRLRELRGRYDFETLRAHEGVHAVYAGNVEVHRALPEACCHMWVQPWAVRA